MSRFVPKRRASNFKSRQFSNPAEEHPSVWWDEPWVAIFGGGIFSFGGLWFLSDLEISAKKAAEEEELVKTIDNDYDDLLGANEAPTRKKANKSFTAF